jgi:hypothetical protein
MLRLIGHNEILHKLETQYTPYPVKIKAGLDSQRAAGMVGLKKYLRNVGEQGQKR